MVDPVPVRSISGHLVFCGDSSVWACWQVEPFGYPHKSPAEAETIHARTTAALLALPEESLIVSLVRPLDAGEIAERIRGGVGNRSAGWAASARRHGELVARGGAFERVWLLSVRLPDGKGPAGWLHQWKTATGDLLGGVGPPGSGELSAAVRSAAQIEERLSPHLGLRPLTSSQIMWVYEKAVSRGAVDPPFPQGSAKGGVVVRRLDRDAVYYEGGRKSDPDRPRHWRYLTVDHPDHGVGYQTYACLADTPPVWTFPYGSGELLWHLDDQLPFPVDWTLRLHRLENDTARRRAEKAKRNVIGALAEPGTDPAGPPPSLSQAVEAVDEQRSALEENPALPSFRASLIVGLGDRELAGLERKAGVLESVFGAGHFNFYRPTGGQLTCLAASVPGPDPGGVVAEYAQDLLPDGLASLAPFATSGVGDTTGLVLGESLDARYRRPVFLDPPAAPLDVDGSGSRSASLAAVGQLGAGKSFLAKTLIHAGVGMGAQIVVVDRTDAGEYVRLGGVLAGSSQVIEVTDTARVCLDPFRVFDADELRLRYGVGFLTLLTATSPSSAAGTQVWRAAQQVLDKAREDGTTPRLSNVVEQLDRATAGEVASKLEALSDIGLGPLVFADRGAPVDLAADYVCFWVPGLRLPTPDTPRDELLPEELWGRAVLYLVAAFSRRVLFASRERFAALVLDEAHALTRNPQGAELIRELITDGRKHLAGVWAFSQLASDFTLGDGSTDLDALLGYRLVFATPAKAASSALSFVGAGPETKELITTLSKGECLLRDPKGRLGVVRITPPDDPTVEAAFSTTPGTPVATPDRLPVWTFNGHSPTPPDNLVSTDAAGGIVGEEQR